MITEGTSDSPASSWGWQWDSSRSSAQLFSDNRDDEVLLALSAAVSMDYPSGVFASKIPQMIPHIVFDLVPGLGTAGEPTLSCSECKAQVLGVGSNQIFWLGPSQRQICIQCTSHSFLHQPEVMDNCQRDSGKVIMLLPHLLCYPWPPPDLIDVGVLLATLLLHEIIVLCSPRPQDLIDVGVLLATRLLHEKIRQQYAQPAAQSPSSITNTPYCLLPTMQREGTQLQQYA